MNRFIALSTFVMILSFCGQVGHESGRQIVLPNSKLLRCSSDCSQLWQDNLSDTNAIFPQQVSLDVRGSCPMGITAIYDKTVSTNELKAAIDRRYGKWAVPENGDPSVPVKLWRVEPEEFAIQFAIWDKETAAMTLGQALSQTPRTREKMNASDKAPKVVIYLAFTGTKCRAQ